MRRFTRTPAGVALAATMVAGTAGWASGSTQRAVTGPPPGNASWRADEVLGRRPLVVGNLDGAPLELRYRADARAWVSRTNSDKKGGSSFLRHEYT